MKKLLLIGLMALCALSMSAKQYPITVSSFGNYDFFGKKIVMSSLYEDTPTSDPEFCYYAQFVASYMLMYGARFTFEGEQADVCIMLGYGVNTGQKRVESDPIYATVPSMGVYVDYWGGPYYAPYGYHSQVVGYSEHEVQQFEKFIDIQAYEAPENDAKRKDPNAWKSVWKIRISSTDDFNDIHTVFPYMIHGACEFFGKVGQASMDVNSNIEDMILFQKIKHADLCTARQVVSWPDVDSLSRKAKDKEMDILVVELRDDKTVVTIYSKQGFYTFKDDTHIQVGDQQFPVTGGENIEVGRLNCKPVFCLIFPVLPKGLEKIDLISEKFSFYGIKLHDTRDRRYSIIR